MTKTIEDINLYTWYISRELDHVPEHFTKAKTSITSESKHWVLESLVGRFAITQTTSLSAKQIAFEDPKEALFYELKWA